MTTRSRSMIYLCGFQIFGKAIEKFNTLSVGIKKSIMAGNEQDLMFYLGLKIPRTTGLLN